VDRRGVVAHRVRVERFPFSVGRAYTSDLVVDDPHVAPSQLVIDETPEGGVTLRDAGAAHAGVMALPVAGELVVQAGRTRIRVRDRDFPVRPTLPLVRRMAFVEWLFEHWSAPIAVFALLMLVGMVWVQQATWRESGLASRFNPIFLATLGIAAWCGGWALVTRFLRQRARFPAHVAVAGMLVLASQLSDELFQVVRFVVASITAVQWAELTVTALFAALLLYGHLRVAGVGRRRTRGLAAFLGGALVFGFQALSQTEDQPDWVSDLPYWSRLEPLPVSWLPQETPDDFFARTEALDAELEELAAKKP
jgi:hypothetical protein